MCRPYRTSSLEEVFLDPGFFWSWERFEDRWINYFGYAEEELVLTHVDVMENYDTLVCGNLKSNFMGDKQFIKVRGSPLRKGIISSRLVVSPHRHRRIALLCGSQKPDLVSLRRRGPSCPHDKVRSELNI